MTDAALARRTQRALTRSTSLWTRRLRATASASSRSALRVRTAAWRRAPRALRTAGLRALLATTGTTCRAGRVSRSRCAVRASGSLRTAPRRRARARLALRTSIKTPWVIVRRRASRSLRAARVSACRRTPRYRAANVYLAVCIHTSNQPNIAQFLVRLSPHALPGSWCHPKVQCRVVSAVHAQTPNIKTYCCTAARRASTSQYAVKGSVFRHRHGHRGACAAHAL